VTLAEAATIAGSFSRRRRSLAVQQPARCKDRRNVVLQAMVDAGYITEAAADRAVHEPLIIVQRRWSPRRRTSSTTWVRRSRPVSGLTTTTTQAVDVYTTLDLHLQRLAQDAVARRVERVDSMVSRRKRGKAEAAADRVGPRTGEISRSSAGARTTVAVRPGDLVAAAAAGRSSSRSCTSRLREAGEDGRTV